MTFALVVSVLGIAVVDSVNPSALAMTSYLLTRPNPWRAVAAYIAGIFTLYLAAGLVVVFAFGSAVDTLIDRLSSPGVPYVVEALLGAAALWFALRRPKAATSQTPRVPTTLSAPRAFLLGVTITAVEATTAIPYLGALAIVARADANPAATVALLVAYNLIFVAPAIVLALTARHTKAGFLDKIRDRLKPSPRAAATLRILCGIVGTLLLLDSATYFATGDPLFPA